MQCLHESQPAGQFAQPNSGHGFGMEALAQVAQPVAAILHFEQPKGGRGGSPVPSFATAAFGATTAFAIGATTAAFGAAAATAFIATAATFAAAFP